MSKYPVLGDNFPYRMPEHCETKPRHPWSYGIREFPHNPPHEDCYYDQFHNEFPQESHMHDMVSFGTVSRKDENLRGS